MKVNADETWPAISSYFEGERKSNMSRSFSVTPLLESLRAVPSEYWRQPMELVPWKMVRMVSLSSVISAPTLFSLSPFCTF
jgi:hypothetical protein